jgi:ATP-dependent DNA helicase PIF1
VFRVTLDELVQWVEEAVARLPEGGATRERAAHVRRMHDLLVEADEPLANDWHALAKKIAKLIGEKAPPKPVDARRSKRSRPGKKSHAQPVKLPRRLAKKHGGREPIELNAELTAAFQAVEKGRQIIFVTGGAGTGKSTFIRELRERFPEKKSVVLAPTGVAALNAGGQTIHSFCKLPLRPVTPEDIRKADDPELVKELEMVIIDEVSMVRADMLDGVDAFLRLNRKSELPFGGVQIVLVGDLFQLPPVVTRNDEEIIAARYPSPHFFSARALQGLRFFPVELQIVYRQKDRAFAELLAHIRDGRDIARAVAELNSQCAGRAHTARHLILVPTRKAAAEENATRLDALKGKPEVYLARRDGSFASASEDRLPAPPELGLRPGAQVMFVRNDSERRWVNGTLGVVTSMTRDKVKVVTDDGEEHEVERIEWEDIRYAWDETKKEIVEEVAGVYEQIPLMLAWAVTIHKAQGLTLERVTVDLARGAFADGQVYVALSRARTLEGLSLKRAVRPGEVRCSEAARGFYQRMRRRN